MHRRKSWTARQLYMLEQDELDRAKICADEGQGDVSQSCDVLTWNNLFQRAPAKKARCFFHTNLLFRRWAEITPESACFESRHSFAVVAGFHLRNFLFPRSLRFSCSLSFTNCLNPIMFVSPTRTKFRRAAGIFRLALKFWCRLNVRLDVGHQYS